MMTHRLMELLIQRLRMFQPSSQPEKPEEPEETIGNEVQGHVSFKPTAALVLLVIRLGLVVLLLLRLPLLLPLSFLRLPLLLHHGLRELFFLVLLRLPLILLVRHLLP